MEIPERWKAVPGYDGKYLVSNLGRIRRKDKKGRIHEMHPRWANRGESVTLYHNETKVRRFVPMLKLVAETWYGEVPEGMIVCHQNGVLTDHSADNVVFRTRAYNNTCFKRTRRRPVMKVDAAGHPVEYYPSVEAAARANYTEGTVISRYCRGKNQKPFDDEGHTFRYSDGSTRGRMIK